MNITINGVTQSKEQWQKQSGVRGSFIDERLREGYAGSALLIPQKQWKRLDALDEAEPKDAYEKAVRKMIKADIAQFRFDIIVELCRDIGLGAFKSSMLRRCLSRANFRYPVAVDNWNVPVDGSLWSFNGPKGKPRMSWMLKRAEQAERWVSPPLKY